MQRQWTSHIYVIAEACERAQGFSRPDTFSENLCPALCKAINATVIISSAFAEVKISYHFLNSNCFQLISKCHSC